MPKWYIRHRVIFFWIWLEVFKSSKDLDDSLENPFSKYPRTTFELIHWFYKIQELTKKDMKYSLSSVTWLIDKRLCLQPGAYITFFIVSKICNLIVPIYLPSKAFPFDRFIWLGWGKVARLRKRCLKELICAVATLSTI